MNIREIMTTDIAVAEPDTTVEEIATMMKDEDTGAIPVVNEDQEIAGIVTDRDIVLRCIAAGKDATECTAEEVMTTDIEWVEPDSSVDDAARIMAERQIRRLPVVEENRIVGIISLGDLAVKSQDDNLSGDTLEDVSKGVKEQGGRNGQNRSRNQSKARSSAVKQASSTRGGSEKALSPNAPLTGRGASEPRERTERLRGQAGGSRSGVNTPMQRTRPKQEMQEPISERPQGVRSESSGRKQGITARNSREENARNDKVVPFRAENDVRNKNVAKPKSGRRAG